VLEWYSMVLEVVLYGLSGTLWLKVVLYVLEVVQYGVGTLSVFR